MGIAEEADRTLFVRNLDSKVTEELLFELFVQAGPLIKTKIPKDKTFGFAIYKHEESVHYAIELLNGMSLYGRPIQVQFRSGSTHGTSPGISKNSSPANTPNLHGQSFKLSQYGGGSRGAGGSWPQESSSQRGYRQHPYQDDRGNSSGHSHHSRSQRYSDDSGSGRHQRGHGNHYNHHDDRTAPRGWDSRDNRRRY
ncbi:RNA-binding protein 7 [Aplochiton taeniatus]